jgi:hypothetical protein
LGPLQTKTSENYLVLGDAPLPFLTKALEICEGVEKDYLNHFGKTKRFTVSPPSRRLAIVVLSGPKAYGAYLGIKPDEAVGGEYDLSTNHLVIFDNRGREQVSGDEARANTMALVHEATHQLTYNTGLLERGTDIPKCINEGLAVYAEVRRPDEKKGKIGDRNDPRLNVLLDAANKQEPWFAVSRLITDDSLFDKPETEQLAYAQSWLLVHALMNSQTRREQFKKYLAALRGRREASQRLKDAAAAFGDLDRLDQELIKYYTTLTGNRRGRATRGRG